MRRGGGRVGVGWVERDWAGGSGWGWGDRCSGRELVSLSDRPLVALGGVTQGGEKLIGVEGDVDSKTMVVEWHGRRRNDVRSTA